MRPTRVVIAGGGTGGHLYPGIAVARELLRRHPDARITFAGTARGIESRVVPLEGFELDLLRSAGLKGTSGAALLRAVLLLPLGGFDAWRILSRRSPDLVIGVGGYSSGPVVLAAAVRGIPTLLLEQNAVPGLTNRLLARVVSAAAVTFDSTAAYFGRRAFVAGNPVRPEFVSENAAPGVRAVGPPRLLIFGGSQGSHAINVAMVEAAPQLAAHPGGMEITHQTGERDLELVKDGYRRAGVQARVEPFLFAMDREISDGRSRRLPRRRDDDRRADRRRPAGAARAAADRRGRSPAQERRGAGRGRGRRDRRAEAPDRRADRGAHRDAPRRPGAPRGHVGRGADDVAAECGKGHRRQGVWSWQDEGA